jgi:hypothetical protein
LRQSTKSSSKIALFKAHQKAIMKEAPLPAEWVALKDICKTGSKT